MAGTAEAGGAGRARRPAWVAIDLGALARNLQKLRERVAPAAVLAVVKSDAYGHGAVAVARRLDAEGVDWFGVALAGEGAELRRSGVAAPILVLGTAEPEELELYRAERLVPTVSSAAQLAMWAGRAASGPPQPIHLKVDTGMSRLGLAPAEVGEALASIRASPGLALGGLVSHLAEAEDLEGAATERQLGAFRALVELLTPEERSAATLHLANSAGALYRPASRHDLVRLGLALYGVDPAGRDEALEPVMSVAARIVLVREVAAGTKAGYGGTWTASRASRLAVVPVGYGDGYPWRLSNRAEVLVAGRRAPVAGRVSMDMTIVDVTGIPAAVGDEAVLVGRQGEESIGAVELAERAGTIPWEVLCGFGLRLPRIAAGEGGRPGAAGGRR